MKSIIIKTIVSIGFLTVGTAFVSMAETDREKIIRLEKQLNLLSRQVYTSPANVSQAIAQPSEDPSTSMGQDAQLNALEQTYQQLVSRFEELEHRVNQLYFKVEAQRNDGVVEAEEPNGAHATNDVNQEPRQPETSQLPPKKPTDTPQKGDVHSAKEASEIATKAVENKDLGTLPVGQPQEEYDKARELLTKQDYKEAERAFKAFLKQFGDHMLAANATYWLGETYYVQQKYDKAIVIFAQGYEAFSTSAKGPDMLLKIAMCLEKQKKNNEACITLDQLGKSHPQVTQGIGQAAARLRKQVCGK